MEHLNKRQEWEQIRNVLKDKYHPSNPQQGQAGDSWQKYQQLTGKSKEEIINLLHRQ